jgi:AcrR family transcriptional regulator
MIDTMSSAEASYGDPQTRERILGATWEILEERGAVSLADVAARSGVSRQAVYLHFGDRVGLLVALVDHIDLTLGSLGLRRAVFDAPDGVSSLRQWVETMSWYTAKIDAVCRILECGQYHDDALAAAWRNRMARRRNDLVGWIVKRIASEGRLAPGWTSKTAADLVYVVTMPASWRELTVELGWSHKAYARHLSAMLESAFVTTT